MESIKTHIVSILDTGAVNNLACQIHLTAIPSPKQLRMTVAKSERRRGMEKKLQQQQHENFKRLHNNKRKVV